MAKITTHGPRSVLLCLLTAACLMVLIGCGNTGDLYLESTRPVVVQEFDSLDDALDELEAMEAEEAQIEQAAQNEDSQEDQEEN